MVSNKKQPVYLLLIRKQLCSRAHEKCPARIIAEQREEILLSTPFAVRAGSLYTSINLISISVVGRRHQTIWCCNSKSKLSIHRAISCHGYFQVGIQENSASHFVAGKSQGPKKTTEDRRPHTCIRQWGQSDRNAEAPQHRAAKVGLK